MPISSTKSMIGHSFGAAGAIESVACVQTIRTGWIHPTINYETRTPTATWTTCRTEAPGRRRRRALKNSFGFGGQNACLVFKRYEGLATGDH